MSLQGTLDTFAVADVIRLLASTTKTGQLTIEGDRGTGRLWFDAGSLIGGDPAADGKVVHAVFNLLRFEEGSFLFEADASPAEPDAAQSAVDVLVAAEQRLEVWREVESVVPSPDVTVRLRDQLESSEATVTREQWSQLVVIGGGTTAWQFASVLELDEVGAAVAIKQLVDAGLAVVDQPGGPGHHRMTTESPVEQPATLGGGPELSVVGSVDAAPQPAPDPAPAVDTVAPADAGLADTWADTLAEPRPTLRSLVRDVATAPVERPFEAEVPPPPAAVEPEVTGPGSVDVALDTQLSEGAADHSYLASAEDDTTLLPEPLLSDDGSGWTGVEQAETRGPGSQLTPAAGAEPEDLSTQLDSLSPAAARAVAAAATDENDSGQSALRKIISNGRG